MPSTAFAQGLDAWPTGTVKMVVPYAAGGATDMVARALAEKMTVLRGHAVLVENKPGAGTTLAAAQVARAQGDGLTLYMTTSAHTISASIYKKLDYHPIDDFAPLTLIAKVPLVLVVRPGLNIRTLDDFVRHAQAHPDKMAYASPGNGTAQHLAGAMFNMAQQTKMVHVPYKGDAPAITDVLGGSVDAMFATLTGVLAHIASGKLQAVAIAHDHRVEKIPKIPTFAQAGLKNFEYSTWFGVLAPASMRNKLRERIGQDIRSAVLMPEMRQKWVDMGAEVVASEPAQFHAFMQEESRKWQAAVQISAAEID
ncbi:tripartite tricarboxylate transporter substrate binding protein [Verminephrobacter aporrectodeae]|uniref:tripartite tricarboxylate transporter substrate binding protein n=1 Tax=Verminephrobacter aporrectodeae TaxID=1110389 RepID=UPI001F4730DF|nr:tripartite tricarboxylate transporter substrate binding protein [Verminephrobacter aporrectodeae]